MPNLEKIVTSLEASRKIKEYLGDDAPEAILGDYYEEYCGARIYIGGKYTFQELILDVLPKVHEKRGYCKNHWKIEVYLEDLFNGSMEAVSERILSLIKE